MNIVITMAGLGTRFAEAGYQEPKFKISVCGKTLFEWSMLSLAKLNRDKDVRYIFIVQKRVNAKSFIREKMNELGVTDLHMIEINNITDGQASTVLYAKKYWRASEELLIYNIDTYVEPGLIHREQFFGDGMIHCFNGAGEHWSFAKVNHSGFVTCVTEKQRISDHCSIGLYYFKNCDSYVNAYHEFYANWNSKQCIKEKYIAPIYNQIIKDGGIVRICALPASKVHCLGTPQEVEDFKKLP